MALSKGARSALFENVTVNYNNSTAISTTSIDTTATTQIAAEVRCTYGSAQTVGARLEVYGSLDDSTYGTQPFATYDLTMPATSSSVVQHFWISGAPRYLKFKIKNPDTATSNANLSAVYLYLQQQTVS